MPACLCYDLCKIRITIYSRICTKTGEKEVNQSDNVADCIITPVDNKN